MSFAKTHKIIQYQFSGISSDDPICDSQLLGRNDGKLPADWRQELSTFLSARDFNNYSYPLNDSICQIGGDVVVRPAAEDEIGIYMSSKMIRNIVRRETED